MKSFRGLNYCETVKLFHKIPFFLMMASLTPKPEYLVWQNDYKMIPGHFKIRQINWHPVTLKMSPKLPIFLLLIKAFYIGLAEKGPNDCPFFRFDTFIRLGNTGIKIFTTLQYYIYRFELQIFLALGFELHIFSLFN